MAQTGNHKGLQFGIFLAPFHRVGENPTLGMARDMELIEWLDELGYDEAWIGEHHSAGWETIASPEVFIGAADRAHALHPARLGRDQPAVSPPADGGEPLRAARPHVARPHHAGLRPGRAAVGRLHDGHRSLDPARPHGAVAGRHHGSC